MTFDEWYQKNKHVFYACIRDMDGDYELMEIAFNAGYRMKEDEITLANPLNDMTEEEVEHFCYRCGSYRPLKADVNPCIFCEDD